MVGDSEKLDKRHDQSELEDDARVGELLGRHRHLILYKPVAGGLGDDKETGGDEHYTQASGGEDTAHVLTAVAGNLKVHEALYRRRYRAVEKRHQQNEAGDDGIDAEIDDSELFKNDTARV